MILKLLTRVFIILALFSMSKTAMPALYCPISDTILQAKTVVDTIPYSDTLIPDSTISQHFKKREKAKTEYKAPLEDEVKYNANDSMPFDIENQKMYLYGNGKITYQDIELTADFIEIDMATNTVYATGVTDSLGKKIGRPVFVQGDEKFQADTMYYNFNTKKGFIKKLITEEEGGFLHSETTKRMADETICIKDGKYTTCDLEHPHFYIHLSKAKVIPNDKIVSGPANLVIADIPTPLGIPFGFFPNQQKYTSGILFPEYGEEKNRGFFLRNGGYYLAISDYFDLAIRGDIYTKGTWGTKLHTNYKKRYRYKGGLDLKYYSNVVGEKGLPNFSKNKDFSILWNHSQDSKANPSSSFSANVNISSTSYDANQTYSSESYLNNTKSSSISYSKRWGKDINLSANFRHSQNSRNKSVSLTLPSMTFNVARQYPFRKKNKVGDMKWYENIELKYNAKLENQINAGDSVIFTRDALDYLKNGFQHDIPVSASFKFWKFFNLTPSLKYTGRLYSKSIRKSWDETIMNSDSSFGAVNIDTINTFSYANDFAPNASLSINPTIYGMFQFKKGRIKAFRHVLSPSLSFNYKPDMGADNPDIWKLTPLGPDSVDVNKTYSIYEGSLYGSPRSKKKSGVFSFGLGNNIEMKMKSRNDTIDKDVKIKILESLRFSSGYDIYRENNKLNNISITGRTTLFKNLSLNFGGTVDPYTLDSINKRTNSFELKENKRIGRLTAANFSTGYAFKPKGTKEKSAEEEGIIGDYRRDYVDFNVPWSIRFDYTWRYSKPAEESVVTQTFSFSGDLKLTDKWKIAFSSGYDIDAKEFTYTSIDIYRDLHCWEARFTWIPFGYHQSYNFQINVKSTVLKDLKWAKRKSWYDNF
ncbi:MAG: putative LPS assembly protein LptD [Bacteroidota bacterium]|nr:putative LPS assembly protein LptD [Bacteroidota bacterium]